MDDGDLQAQRGEKQGGLATTPTAAKRRRGLGLVTANACVECRKKRSKCDGRRPCGRCQANGVDCVYQQPQRTSKDNLRHEIEELRRQKQTSEHVLSTLVRQPELTEEVLARLRNGENVDVISASLARASSARVGDTSEREEYGGEPQPQASRDATRSLLAHFGAEADHSSPWGNGLLSTHSQMSRSDSHPVTTPRSSEPARGMQRTASSATPELRVSWTSVTSDAALVQHLLDLYFCWEYPSFASLSKEQFLEHYRQGNRRYCSPMLVNALLSLGCRFSSQPASISDAFFRESLRLFGEEDDHHSLTSIQTLGILSIREAGVGHDSESFFYAGQSIRLAVELGLHNNSEGFDDDEVAVRAATFWGAFALDHAWSLATGVLPQCSRHLHLPPKPPIISELEAATWVPVTDEGEGMPSAVLPLSGQEEERLKVELGGCPASSEQPSNVRSVYKCFCELSELVHDTLYVLHSPGHSVSSRSLLNSYTEFLNWYQKIPTVLRLGVNYTPAVLFVHMYFHFCVLLLFRGFIQLRIIGSSIRPRDICLQASGAIQGLVASYSSLYSLKRTPSFVPYFTLSSILIRLAIEATTSPSPSQPSTEESSPSTQSPGPKGSGTPGLQPHASDAIVRGIMYLKEMVPSNQFAAQAIHILRWHARKLHVNVDFKTGDEGAAAAAEEPGDIMTTWGAALASSVADNPRNPLFWPFHGGPMLPMQPAALREAGFELWQ